jgi:hypothetical protein
MGSGKRQAFSRGRIFDGYFERVLGVYLGGNGREATWGGVREATLSESGQHPRDAQRVFLTEEERGKTGEGRRPVTPCKEMLWIEIFLQGGHEPV